MSSPPSELPEPIPAPKAQPPRGRDRALSASPLVGKKNSAPPPPQSPPPNATPAYEFAPNEAARAAAAPSIARLAVLPTAPPLVRNHMLAWLIILAIVGIALAFTIPFTLGVFMGNQDRAQFVERQAQEHFQRALAYESETYTQLAIAELELALQYNPNYAPARAKLQSLKSIHTANVEQEPQEVAIAKQLYAGAEQALDAQDWNNAIDLFEELRRVKNDYRASEVDAFLVRAYLAAGKEALLANDVDLARRRFDAALALDPNNAEARTQRERAIMYFNGIGFMGTSWSSAVNALEELYARDPNFGDVKEKLLTSHIGFGDFASAQGAYCIAAREYERALALGANVDAQTKAVSANEACKTAILNPTALPTPTPDALTTPNPFATPNPFVTPNPFATPVPVFGNALYAPGVRVRQNAACNGTGDIKGSVQDAQGNPLANVGIKIYNDFGYLPPYARTNNAGEYEIVLGSDKGLFHLVIVDDFGSNASAVLDVEYPGGNVQGCHINVNWTRLK